MFKTRLLSGIVLVILAVLLIISGGSVLLFSTLVISCIGMFELYRVFQVEKSLLAVIGYLAAVVFYCQLKWNFLPDILMLFLGFMILLMFIYVFSYPRYKADQVMAVFFGMFYVAVMLSYVYQIRMLERGVYLAFLVFLCSWGCDVTPIKPKEIYRGSRRRCPWIGASDLYVLLYFPEAYGFIRVGYRDFSADCSYCRTYLHGGGSDGLCNQEKL